MFGLVTARMNSGSLFNLFFLLDIVPLLKDIFNELSIVWMVSSRLCSGITLNKLFKLLSYFTLDHFVIVRYLCYHFFVVKLLNFMSTQTEKKVCAQVLNLSKDVFLQGLFGFFLFGALVSFDITVDP